MFFELEGDAIDFTNVVEIRHGEYAALSEDVT